MTTPTVAEILADPAAAYWLKGALEGAMERDPVDAANDAEVLAKVLATRVAEVAHTALAELEKEGK